MNENQSANTKSPVLKYALASIFGIVLVYGLVTYIVDSRVSYLENETRVRIEEQNSVLVTIAETTARNGADAVTETIIRDCTPAERNRFDTLLSSLDGGLPQFELTELERLFGRCGGFYAERKAVMVARMMREFEIFEQYIELQELITGSEVAADFKLESWRTLVNLERQQSDAFSELVSLQEQIIVSLLQDRNQSSDAIVEILQEVREVQEDLLLANTQASEVRTQLTNL